MVLQPVDRNAHYRERRRRQRRRRRARRLAVLLVLAGLTVAVGGYALRAGGADAPDAVENASASRAAAGPVQQPKPKPDPLAPRPAPLEMRGVHVTMALASIPGKLEEYLGLRGLNTLQLDIKDENGEIGFVPSAVPLAKRIGAAKPYYKPRAVAQLARRRGVYLVGRIVCFEDPVLAEALPGRAVQRRDGSVWKNHAGLGWADPHNRANWEYVVDLAVASAKLGFDEIQFDYVRFPTDGDIEEMVFPADDGTPMAWRIPQFVQYAAKRLKPLGVRVSADVFGLAATRDLGIGQNVRRIGRYLDAIYPMVYPSHFYPGEYNLDDPNAAPGETVEAALRHFNRELLGLPVEVIPWLQDFSYGRTYSLADVQSQIDAARASGSPGFLLWNAAGIYTDGALTHGTR